MKFETIATHSSVADYSFLADEADSVFNLGLTSSDLCTDLYVYKFAKANAENLRNVVVFASVFAPGYNLKKTSERCRSVVYRHFFGSPILENVYFHSRLVARVERRCRAAKDLTLPENYCGYDRKTYYGINITASEMARTHLREHRREPDQMVWLQKLLDEATAAEHRVYIVIPPFRSDYKTEIESFMGSEEIFRKYYALNLGGHQILDYYSSPEFGDKYLGDTDHLNEEGARRLTREIARQVSGNAV